MKSIFLWQLNYHTVLPLSDNCVSFGNTFSHKNLMIWQYSSSVPWFFLLLPIIAMIYEFIIRPLLQIVNLCKANSKYRTPFLSMSSLSLISSWTSVFLVFVHLECSWEWKDRRGIERMLCHYGLLLWTFFSGCFILSFLDNSSLHFCEKSV